MDLSDLKKELAKLGFDDKVLKLSVITISVYNFNEDLEEFLKEYNNSLSLEDREFLENLKSISQEILRDLKDDRENETIKKPDW
jgi:hypothetical protein|nr:MAG TPA: hypothetical protein [Caudoviricetes sp.]